VSARWAGEAFLTVLSGSDASGGMAFAERVRSEVESSVLIPDELTVSAGVAAYHSRLDTAEALLCDAEDALTTAKSDGRNRVRLHGGGAPSDAAPTASQTGQDPAGASAPARSTPGGIGRGRRVLLVEDDEAVRSTLRTFLAREEFSVTEAGDAASALWELRTEYDIVVTDIRLPGANGTELVAALKSRWPATQAIVITGLNDAQVAAEALNAGADRYLFKPFGLDEFQGHLEDSLNRRRIAVMDRQERHLLTHEARERADQARQAILKGARALVTAVEVRDPYTRGHSMRVSAYAQELAGAGAGIDLESLRLACELHDVGKIGVPDAILNKEDRLTEPEYDEVKRHPLTGRRILEPLLSDETVLSVVTWHHERWDGSGYPDGLAGEEIPLPARIVGVVDALDAMTSTRAYRKALPWDSAVDQIRDLAGAQFDPGLAATLDQVLPTLKQLYDDL